jgi:hypothetical protein
MNKVFISTASIAITILLYYLGRTGEHKLNFITTAPQNVTYNYEKYGILGIIGIVAILIYVLFSEIKFIFK